MYGTFSLSVYGFVHIDGMVYAINARTLSHSAASTFCHSGKRLRHHHRIAPNKYLLPGRNNHSVQHYDLVSVCFLSIGLQTKIRVLGNLEVYIFYSFIFLNIARILSGFLNTILVMIIIFTIKLYISELNSGLSIRYG